MRKQTSLAILFADVTGSTQLYEQLGNARARRAIARCVAIMKAATKKQGATVIKTVGDEVMSTFASADAAATAAVDMQQRISGDLWVDGRSLTIRVGFHFGPVIVEDGDVFGDAVNLASRMADQAKREQILTTAATIARMSSTWLSSTRQVDRAAVKGKRDQIDVYEVVWQMEDLTDVGPPGWAVTIPEEPRRLTLICGNQRVEIDQARPSITMGRAGQNDLVVKDDLVSRLHAGVEYRNGRFVYIDQSINGTYFVDSSEPLTFVRHDSYVLSGAGLISLGRKPDVNLSTVVRYEVSA